MEKKHIFSKLEKNVFIDILRKYSTVVESKKTDGHTLKQKNTAWNKIAFEYNASPHASHQVTTKQLRRLWMNLKQRQREKFTLERQHRLSSRGAHGATDVVILPDVSQLAQSLLGSVDDSHGSDTASELIQIEERSPDARLPSLSPAPMYEVQTQLHPHLPNGTPPHPHIPAECNVCNITNIPQKEYYDRKRRADELHTLELDLMGYKIRKAKAEAEFAELILEKHKSSV